MAHNMKERMLFLALQQPGGVAVLWRISRLTRHHRRHLTEHGKIVRLIVAAAVAVIALFANKLTTI